jgi:3D (Asp-Asp-Asp) domain-containing protein
MKKTILSLLIAVLYSTPLKESDLKIIYEEPKQISLPRTATLESKEIIIKIPVELTGYDNDYACTQSGKGITASGIRASRGTIAVPSNIPLKTTFYINGKEHKALDRGGAIKVKEDGTYVIDVWFPTHKEATEFGRKKGIMYKKDNIYYIEY